MKAVQVTASCPDCPYVVLRACSLAELEGSPDPIALKFVRREKGKPGHFTLPTSNIELHILLHQHHLFGKRGKNYPMMIIFFVYARPCATTL